MNKTTKWLVGLVAVLVVANVALITSVWLRKDATASRPAFKGGDARDYLVNSLSLTDAQTQTFDSLRKEHFETIAQYKSTMRFLKDRLFRLLSEKDTNRIKAQITGYLQDKIGDVQAKIDLATFNHFYQLRSTLREEQKQKFDSAVQNILRTLDPPANHPEGLPPPGRDGMLPPPPEGAPPPPH